MKKNCLIVTNNPKAAGQYKNMFELDYLEQGSYLGVLRKTSGYIQQGWRLLTHPLSGSLKPNQTPYKSVLLAFGSGAGEEANSIGYEDVIMIENSIMTYDKFHKNSPTPHWTAKAKGDFQTIDLSIIDSAARNPMLATYF